MQSGIHVIAEQLSTYGTTLRLEDNALSLDKQQNAGLRDIINKLSLQLQLISLLISTGKDEENINTKSFEILKNCEHLTAHGFANLKLLSNQNTTFKKITDNIKTVLDSYKETISKDYNMKIAEESDTALAAFRKRTDYFWKQNPVTHSPNVGGNTRKKGDDSSTANSDKPHDSRKPNSANGIKSH